VFVRPDAAPLTTGSGSPSSAYRLLSDQLSDYGVDGPYIQPDIHGLSSRLVAALDGSPTVLRDEEVTGSNPVSPTSRKALLTRRFPLFRAALC
jgi:hypothetical protein